MVQNNSPASWHVFSRVWSSKNFLALGVTTLTELVTGSGETNIQHLAAFGSL